MLIKCAVVQIMTTLMGIQKYAYYYEVSARFSAKIIFKNTATVFLIYLLYSTKYFTFLNIIRISKEVWMFSLCLHWLIKQTLLNNIKLTVNPDFKPYKI